jgi:hypothetical protein
LSWVYNWGPAPQESIDAVYVENNIEFVPMAWNGSFNETALRQYYSTHPDAKFLLGFNEPNFKEQANMKPSEAAAKWPLLEAIAADYGLQIVGPAVNWCGNCVSKMEPLTAIRMNISTIFLPPAPIVRSIILLCTTTCAIQDR